MLKNIFKNKRTIILITFIFGFIFILASNLDFFKQDIPKNNISASYQPLSGESPISSNLKSAGNIDDLISSLFEWGIVIAVILAVIMIIIGGIQYMTTDAIDDKKYGIDKVNSALGGLILAFAAWFILNTINPDILKTRLDFTGVDHQDYYMPPRRIPALEMPIVFTSGTRDELLMGINPIGERSIDGGLNFTNYWDGDKNTNEKRGNANNLLREGSVALSPDLIRRLNNPPVGSEIFVNGKSVGFFEDTTGKYTNSGRPIVNTIDIYDPDRRYGSVLSGIPKDQWQITVGQPRIQIDNP